MEEIDRNYFQNQFYSALAHPLRTLVSERRSSSGTISMIGS